MNAKKIIINQFKLIKQLESGLTWSTGIIHSKKSEHGILLLHAYAIFKRSLKTFRFQAVYN